MPLDLRCWQVRQKKKKKKYYKNISHLQRGKPALYAASHMPPRLSAFP